jgi:hypothetical protein
MRSPTFLSSIIPRAKRAALIGVIGTTITLPVIFLDRSASAALCNLSALSLPQRDFASQLGGQQLSVGVAARLDFQQDQQGIVTITETIKAVLPDAPNAVTSYLQEQASELPNDECGAQVVIDGTTVGASGGDLVIVAVLKGQQWGCIINVKFLVAEGTMTFRIVFHPTESGNKVKLVPAVTHTDNLTSTIPDIDPDFTEKVDEQIHESVSNIVAEVQQYAVDFAQKIDAMQASAPDPTEAIQPLYKPKFLSIGFDVQGTALVLTRKRQAAAREGTACTLRNVAASKWNEL